jgi:hypothetical protein
VILKTVQHGLQFQSAKVLRTPIEIPAEFETHNAEDHFPPTPSDEPELDKVQFSDFTAPTGNEGEDEQAAADGEVA